MKKSVLAFAATLLAAPAMSPAAIVTAGLATLSVASTADAGTNYNSSRSNRGKRPSVAKPWNGAPNQETEESVGVAGDEAAQAGVALKRMPSGYNRERSGTANEYVFRKVPKGRYTLSVRVRGNRAGSLDSIENDGGPIECDWTEDTSSVTCALVIETADRPDVTVKLLSFVYDDEGTTETDDRDRPASAEEPAQSTTRKSN